jgi:DNA-binding transcriptional ArsR family regulator
MPVTRRTVLERLAATSDAERCETTTAEALAAGLEVPLEEVEAHLRRLTACELARTAPDGRVRVTVTGEELLELDTEGTVVVDCPDRRSGP